MDPATTGAELRGQLDERARVFAADVRQAASNRRIELQERLEILRAPKA